MLIEDSDLDRVDRWNPVSDRVDWRNLFPDIVDRRNRDSDRVDQRNTVSERVDRKNTAYDCEDWKNTGSDRGVDQRNPDLDGVDIFRKFCCREDSQSPPKTESVRYLLP